MDNTVRNIKELLKTTFIKYLICAAIAFILEILVSYTVFNLLHIEGILSHILGLLSGFVFQSNFTLIFVYNKKINIKNLFLFLNTFVFGLIVSSIIFSISFYVFNMSMISCKFIAMIITFVINYTVRSYIFKN